MLREGLNSSPLAAPVVPHRSFAYDECATAAARVAILLSTYNGARFLPDQLKSFENQSHPNWIMIASDDGSSDRSIGNLRDFQARRGADLVTIRTGPSRGFVANFLSMACDPAISADFYAFSDQDDIWEADKLSRALGWLQTVPRGTPALYGARTLLIDPEGAYLGRSPLFCRPPTFRNALVQNIAGGNTMVFNEAARRLLMAAGSAVQVPSHDWWLYLLTTAGGGSVFYDRHASVRYRVHEKNLVGANIGTVARWRRLKMLVKGGFRMWTDQNLAALEGVRAQMTEQNRAIFDEFSQARQKVIAGRLLAVRRSGVFRQTVLGSIGLFIGVSLNKI